MDDEAHYRRWLIWAGSARSPDRSLARSLLLAEAKLCTPFIGISDDDQMIRQPIVIYGKLRQMPLATSSSARSPPTILMRAMMMMCVHYESGEQTVMLLLLLLCLLGLLFSLTKVSPASLFIHTHFGHCRCVINCTQTKDENEHESERRRAERKIDRTFADLPARACVRMQMPRALSLFLQTN